MQVALDVFSLEEAEKIARVSVQSGAHLLEVGDPLIKRFGIEAVRYIRESQPEIPIVVELSSSDWVDEQISMATQAGADIVLLLGLTEEIRMERAVKSARRNKVGLILGVPSKINIPQWCESASNYGVDGIAVIRNIDASNKPSKSLRRIRSISKNCPVPLVVSGGFTVKDIANAIKYSWNIIIVGHAIISAPNPKQVIEEIIDILMKEGQ